MERIDAHVLEDKRWGFVVGICGVDEERPIHFAAACAEAEGYDGIAGVHKNKEGVAANRLAVIVAFGDLVTN